MEILGPSRPDSVAILVKKFDKKSSWVLYVFFKKKKPAKKWIFDQNR